MSNNPHNFTKEELEDAGYTLCRFCGVPTPEAVNECPDHETS